MKRYVSKYIKENYGKRMPQDAQVIDHGIDHAQYFQGHGLAHSDYIDTDTGAGETFYDAYQDALEQLAQQDWDVEAIDRIIKSKEPNLPREGQGPSAHEVFVKENPDAPEDFDSELYYYVSVDVR